MNAAQQRRDALHRVRFPGLARTFLHCTAEEAFDMAMRAEEAHDYRNRDLLLAWAAHLEVEATTAQGATD